MLTVNLEDDVVAGLQRHARPLVDDVNSVIRRLLRELDGDELNAKPPSGPTSATESRTTKRERTLHVLLREGIIKAGTALVLAERQIQGRMPSTVAAAQLRCEVGSSPRARQNIVWSADGQAYSLSALTEKLRNELGLPLVGGALNGYDFWCLASAPGRTLWELAEEAGRSSRN